MKRLFSFSNLIFIILISALMIGLTNCSSIINGSKQIVSISSDPKEAKIYVNGNSLGTTPKKILLKRGDTHIIEIKMDGYKTYRITTSKDITGWFWGNLLCGGLIGMVIDLATGNAYDIDPDRIHAVLEKGDGAMNILHNQDFGNIDIEDSNGNQIGKVDITWE
jgi:hypothetical protein